ncbi:16S rRNA (cytidine(1402)-2'-O)-methyltransferase [Alkalinema sp. FACHB-956]|uniref:16S rRNA (cytidine(1402)-2'-O)-methyltransferase n=1 Tax=Alkalinema sp. FACHB-956 TaxID=2692768 RepID=UPI0016833A56|nr:16S rRNA (cytidine(1402)-2'-O)-methyltransferase [Alkalinema sp. FACHB-956]MBD2325516.1 16S rRNA (cytidine(1402)-2'-O)-methyltransferase [Alkalinema sp. FACHB-956]
MEICAGTLYLVGTPIGNLEDMTFRAIQVLQQVDWIAAEDTRHTGKLLQHFQIKTPQLSYHEHNRTARIPELLDRLQQGKSIALVTDAGMPCVSDPGYELVKACAEAGFPVVPIPGVTAAITALAASGLPSDRFAFEGFLPAKTKERDRALEALQTETRTLIFYEAPHRLRDTLASFQLAFGDDRAMTIARELTKLHEEFWRGTIAAAIEHYKTREPQGEYTLIVAGTVPKTVELTEAVLKAELLALLRQGISRSQASRQLAQQTGMARRPLYQLALELPDEDEVD